MWILVYLQANDSIYKLAQTIINTTHIQHMYELVAVSSWPNSRLSTWLPPKISFQDEIWSEKRAGSFLGCNDLEEGKGHWKDTLREGFEESLEGFLRIEGRGLGRGGRPYVQGWAVKVLGGKWASLRRETETVSRRSPSWSRKQRGKRRRTL